MPQIEANTEGRRIDALEVPSGVRYGEGVPPQPTRGCGESYELLSGVRGRARPGNAFLSILKVTERSFFTYVPMFRVRQTVFHVTFGDNEEVWGNSPCLIIEPTPDLPRWWNKNVWDPSPIFFHSLPFPLPHAVVDNCLATKIFELNALSQFRIALFIYHCGWFCDITADDLLKSSNKREWIDK